MTREELYIEELYSKHQRFLQAVCRKKVGNDSSYCTLIEDCIQETFFLAYRSYDQLQAHPNVRAWLVKTCLNRLIPYAQKQRKHQNIIPIDTDSLSVIDQNSRLDDHIRTMDVEAFKAKLITALSGQEEQVFLLYFVDEKTMQETAQELNLPINSIRVAIRHIRQKAKVFQGKI